MKEKVYTIIYMIIVAAVFTAGVSLAKVKTEGQIRLNEETKLQRVILTVFGIIESGQQMDAAAVKELYAKRVTRQTVEDLMVYTGFVGDEKKEIIGYAFPVGGMGLWSRIDGMLALDADLQKIIGIDFIRHGETPGLGGRITERWFKEQFKGKVISNGGKEKFITFVKQGKEAAGDEVHAITGATLTSLGVEDFLNKDIAHIKRVMASRTD